VLHRLPYMLLQVNITIRTQGVFERTRYVYRERVSNCNFVEMLHVKSCSIVSIFNDSAVPSEHLLSKLP
jgi:hypothetical protein